MIPCPAPVTTKNRFLCSGLQSGDPFAIVRGSILMDRLPLYISTLCFFLAFAYTVYAYSKGKPRASRFNFAVISVGFLLQAWFMHQRGQALGRCPITNLFEVLIFLSWSIVLLYLLIGPAYRLSLLGAFTAPLVLVLQMIALAAPIDVPNLKLVGKPDAWLELHAAFSVISYGAFAMAGIAGVMYLAQERQLKTHHLRSIFFQMPPITLLASANLRLLYAGLALLTVGLAAGFLVKAPLSGTKLAWGIIMWAIYLAIILMKRFGLGLGPRRVAFLSVVAFTLSLTALWSINYFSGR